MLRKIRTSNHMFERAVSDKLPEYIFENLQTALVKEGKF